MLRATRLMVLMVAALAMLAAASPVCAETRTGLDSGSRRISVPQRPVAVRLEGILQEVHYPLPAEWRVGELTIAVTEETGFLPQGIEPADGDYALVSALHDDRGLTADWIEVIPDKEGARRAVEFRGVIRAFPNRPYQGEWQVGSLTVIVGPDALLDGTPILGYYAQVAGWISDERHVEALSITILDPAVEAARFQFQGPLDQFSPARPSLWIVGGVTGWVDQDTAIAGQPTIGAVAEVRGRRLDSGVRIFETIAVLADSEREIRLRGEIESIDEGQGTWMVAGIQIHLDERTFIDESQARARRGMLAEVIAQRGVDALWALRIRIERPE